MCVALVLLTLVSAFHRPHIRDVPTQLAPPPRESGFTLAQPPLHPEPSGMRPEVLAAWGRNLSHDDWATREEAQAGLCRSGWDGYLVCRHIAGTSDDPEARMRASVVCGRYLRLPITSEVDPIPKIYSLAGPYRYYGPHVGGPPSYTPVPIPSEYTEVPSPQHALALVCHRYYLLAMKREWEFKRRWPEDCGYVVGPHPVYCEHVRFEVEATRLFATDLLKSGVSREWVRWLLDDMRRRGNPWPKTCAKPPAWMMSGMGVKKPVPLW